MFYLIIVYLSRKTLTRDAWIFMSKSI